jgi:hypothetical protein
MHLVPIHGDQGKNLRVDPAQAAGPTYDYPQALAKAIHDHPDHPDGIVYRSRFDDDAVAVVLFDRARPPVRLFPGTEPLSLRLAPELANGLRNT